MVVDILYVNMFLLCKKLGRWFLSGVLVLSIVYLTIMMKQLSESTMCRKTQSSCLWDSHMLSYVNRR